MKLRYLALAAMLAMSACASSGTTPQQTPLQAAQAQVEVEAKAVDLAAITAKAAYDQGYIKPGSAIDQDITVALHAGKAAVDSANASLHAGDVGSASMYLGMAAATITQVSQDIAKAKGGA
jgi:hypothetical protein